MTVTDSPAPVATDPPPPTDAPRRSRPKDKLRKVPFVFGVPGIAFALAFVFVPIFFGAYYAFTDWNGLGKASFIGLDNFQEVFEDPVTSGALKNTLLLAGTFLVGANVVGLTMALALHRTLKSRNFLRAIFFLPAVMSPLAVSFIWQYIFAQDGVANGFLGLIGLDSWQRAWTGDPTWAIWTILFVLIWQYSGLCMVIYLAGLQGISDELIEASAVDGATASMRLRRIVLPLLAPAFTVCITLCLVRGLNLFDQVIALTGGGPVGASETLATQVWRQTFVNGRYGYGAANAVILTLITMVLGFAVLAFMRRRESRI